MGDRIALIISGCSPCSALARRRSSLRQRRSRPEVTVVTVHNGSIAPNVGLVRSAWAFIAATLACAFCSVASALSSAARYGRIDLN